MAFSCKKMRVHYRWIPLILIVWAFFASGCSLKASSSSSSQSSGTASSGIADGTAVISGTVSLPQGANSSLKGGASVYIVGQQDQLVTTGSDGSYNLSVNLKLKLKLDLKAPAKRNRSGAIHIQDVYEEPTNGYQLVIVTSDSTLGTSVSNIVLADQQTYNTGAVPLHQTGNIAGYVTLYQQSDSTGTQVYIPGTSFSAMTADNGSYIMTGVPEGVYNDIRAVQTGYSYGVLPTVQVVSNETTTAASMVLFPSLGATGGVIINGGAPMSTSTNVILSIEATSNALLMKVSQNPNFLNANNQLVDTTLPFSFTGTGWQTNYVVFYDANGLASATYFSAIFIDTNPTVSLNMPGGVVATTNPSFNWTPGDLTNDGFHSVSYRFQLSVVSNFFSNMIDQSGLTNYTYKPAGLALTNNLPYFWRVAIVETNGTQWGWSPFRSFIPDTTPPVLANLTPTNGGSVALNYAFSGTVTDAQGVQSVNVNLDGGAFVSAPISGSNWSSSFSVSNGTHTNMVYAVDIAGNVSATNTVIVTVSDQYPSVAITNATGSFYTNATSMNFAGTMSIGSSYSISSISLLENGLVVPANPGTNNLFWALSGVSLNATNTFQAQAVGSSGMTNLSPIVSIIVDKTPPVASVLSPSNGQKVPGNFTLTASASDSLSGVRSVTFYVAAISNSSFVTNIPSDSNMTASVTIPTSVLSNCLGYYVYAKAMDNAGNTGVSASNLVSYTATVPNLSISSPVAGGSSIVTNATQIAVSGTAAATMFAVANVNASVYTDGASSWSTNSASGTTSWTYNATLTANAWNTVQIYAQDATGVMSPAQTIQLLCDTTPPTVLITSHENGQFLSNNSSNTTVYGTASDSAMSVNSGIAAVYVSTMTNGVTATGFAQVSTGTGWSNTLATGQSGSYTVLVYAMDAAGNSSTTNQVTLYQPAIWWDDASTVQAYWNTAVWDN